jgi:DNA invertase Pin-like site-specific DNA recombinase
MLIGYARGLPHDQNLTTQIYSLQKAGCDKIYTETLSSAKAEHKGLDKALSVLRPDDTFVVWKLDRLGTSIKELLATMIYLSEQGIGVKSLTDRIDTTTSGGKQVYKTFAALRNALKAKTTAGLRVARAKGRKGGRPKRLTASEIQELRELYGNQDIPIPEIRRKFHLARSTFYRYVKNWEPEKSHIRGLFRQLTGRR